MIEPGWRRFGVETTVGGVPVTVAGMHRDGSGPPILFLHGFGSTKEDYADTAFDARFDGRALVAYDAPGCGESACGDHAVLSIPFLRSVAIGILAHHGIDRFHLVGHSMGGLTGLTLAAMMPDRVLSFTSIEGNVAPEDCFLSRQILEHPSDDPEDFMRAFAERAWRTRAPSSPLFASTLRYKVRAEAVGPIFRSMVAISDSEPLLETFLGLPCPVMFVHGDWNRDLSYLPTLRDRGARVTEIEGSGHFPMYSNARALWSELARFITDAERSGPEEESMP